MKLIEKLKMLWIPYLWRLNKAQAILLEVIIEDIQYHDAYMNDKLKEMGFEDWQIYGKSDWYIPSPSDKVDLLIDKIKEKKTNMRIY